MMAGPGVPSPQPATEALHSSGDSAPSGPRPMEPLPLAGETFAGAELLSEGQNLRYDSAEPLFQVITTQQALDSFWQAYLPGMLPHEVDFARGY